MLFSCSSVLCLILTLSQRPKRTEERFCLQTWGQPRVGCRDTDVDWWSPWERAGGGKTAGLERVHGASFFVTSRSEKPGRGNSPTVPFGPYLEKYVLFCFFFFTAPWNMWDLSSLGKDPTHTPAVEAQSLSHGQPGKVPGKISLFQVYCPLFSSWPHENLHKYGVNLRSGLVKLYLGIAYTPISLWPLEQLAIAENLYLHR